MPLKALSLSHPPSPCPHSKPLTFNSTHTYTHHLAKLQIQFCSLFAGSLGPLMSELNLPLLYLLLLLLMLLMLLLLPLMLLLLLLHQRQLAATDSIS